MRRWCKQLVSVAVCVAGLLMVSACEDQKVSMSSDTAKSLTCSTARAGNQAGKISDDMRKQLAQAIADSVNDGKIKQLAQMVHDSHTPEQIRAAFDSLIDKACGPVPPSA